VLLAQGRTHILFSEPVFRTDLFKDFAQQVMVVVNAAEEQAGLHESVQEAMNRVLPGVLEHLQQVQSSVALCNDSVAGVHARLAAMQQQQPVTVADMQGLFRTMSAYAGTLSSQRSEVVGMPQLTLNSAATAWLRPTRTNRQSPE
jgi:hypothetical protein